MDYPERMCPGFLALLVHIHSNPAPFHESGTNNEGLRIFLADGIIASDEEGSFGSGYHTTDKGRRWLEMILGTPYPFEDRTVRWLDPRDAGPPK